MTSRAGWRVSAAAPQSAPSSQPSRVGQPSAGGAQQDEQGERAEQREQRLRMEEDAHPVDDRIGGRERARGQRPAGVRGQTSRAMRPVTSTRPVPQPSAISRPPTTAPTS